MSTVTLMFANLQYGYNIYGVQNPSNKENVIWATKGKPVICHKKIDIVVHVLINADTRCKAAKPHINHPWFI